MLKNRVAVQSDGLQGDRIRLLKFITIFAIGGTERQVVHLARGLDRSQFDLRMACFRRRGDFLEDVAALGVPISEYNVQSLYKPHTFAQQARLARYLRSERIQIVHTYGFYATVFALPAAKLAGVPAVVASIRDTGETLSNTQKRVQRIACRFADSILVNARAVREWLMSQGCDPGRISVINNGIVLDPPQERCSIREELGLPQAAPLVAMIARLNRMKGTEYFLQAAASIASRFPRAHFLIIGDAMRSNAEYRVMLEEQALRLGLEGRLTFTGFRLDVAALLPELAVSVLPSLSEGLSNVLLESMAAEVPVVATNVGGNPEIVQAGVSGIVVPPRDAEALASAISVLLANPDLASRYGAAGRNRVREHFSVEAMVRNTEQHYKEVLGGTLRSLREAPQEAAV